jgi:DNA-directed RNA polymerase alpha subunit
MIINITEKMMKPLAQLIKAIKDDLKNDNKPNVKKGRKPNPAVEKMSFYDSTRAQGKLVTTLKNNGINTAKELASYSKVELLAIRGVADRSVQRIEEVLTEVGLKLKK